MRKWTIEKLKKDIQNSKIECKEDIKKVLGYGAYKFLNKLKHRDIKTYNLITKNFKSANEIRKLKSTKWSLNKAIKLIKKEKLKYLYEVREFNNGLYRFIQKDIKDNPKHKSEYLKIISFKNKEVQSKYSKVKLKQIFLKYKTKSDLINNDRGAYDKAKKIDQQENGFFDSLCSHMIKIGSQYQRMIYVIEFPKLKKAYIGLTYNFEKRSKQHKTMSHNKKVRNLMRKKEKFIIKPLTDYLKKDIAIKKENYYLKKYEKNWEILNIAKTGSLGGVSLIKSKSEQLELCLKHAKKYSNYSNFRKKSKYYHRARRYQLLSEVKKVFN